MTPRRAQHKHVEDLVRRAPQIKRPRSKPFRHPRGVQPRARDIQHSFQHHPVPADLPVELSGPEEEAAVEDGDDGGEAHGDEHGGAEGAPGGGAEGGAERDEGAGEAGEGHLCLVEEGLGGVRWCGAGGTEGTWLGEGCWDVVFYKAVWAKGMVE